MVFSFHIFHLCLVGLQHENTGLQFSRFFWRQQGMKVEIIVKIIPRNIYGIEIFWKIGVHHYFTVSRSHSLGGLLTPCSSLFSDPSLENQDQTLENTDEVKKIDLWNIRLWPSLTVSKDLIDTNIIMSPLFPCLNRFPWVSSKFVIKNVTIILPVTFFPHQRASSP